MKRDDRIGTILNILLHSYPEASIALRYSNPWELLVSVILSAQCTDRKVNEVTDKLFRKYRTIGEYVNADPVAFANDIRSTGFFNAKARNILATARAIQQQWQGQVPETMEELTKLPGVARKTANVVLGNAFGTVVGIAVDTHVHRISQRLRLVPLDAIGGKLRITFVRDGQPVTDYLKDADPVKIERELMRIIPKDQWFGVTYRIIEHGRAVCKAQRPLCPECPLEEYCPARRDGSFKDAG